MDLGLLDGHGVVSTWDSRIEVAGVGRFLPNLDVYILFLFFLVHMYEMKRTFPRQDTLGEFYFVFLNVQTPKKTLRKLSSIFFQQLFQTFQTYAKKPA